MGITALSGFKAYLSKLRQEDIQLGRNRAEIDSQRNTHDSQRWRSILARALVLKTRTAKDP